MAHHHNKIRLQQLANKLLKGTITPAEQMEFDEWYTSEMHNDIIIPKEIASSEEEHRNRILLRIHNEIKAAEKTVQPKKLRLSIAVAAAVLLLIGFGGYFLFNKQIRYHIALSSLHSVPPGGNKAILTLANGKQIILTNTKNGMVATQGNMIINKTANGQIVYTVAASSADSAAQLAYNTITTPNGGLYEVVLPDGSKVWLNSASSLKYPTVFKGKGRDVELTGEAYFEVAKNKNMPFTVHSNGQNVQVLGTHFNINAYADEQSIKTTLLEGSVKISNNTLNPQFLHPGQQSTINKGRPEIMITDADTSQAIAWKNGLFYFKDADVASIMRSLARWYNLKVEFDGQIPQRRFSGKIYRNVNAAEVLEIINYSAINYRVEESSDNKTAKKLIITP